MSERSRLLQCTNDVGHFLPWPYYLDPLPKCYVCHAEMVELVNVSVVPREREETNG